MTEKDSARNEVACFAQVVTYLNDNPKEYVFDRFLPLEWEPFIDLFAIVFSYLPRGMEVFLHEIFAKFDGAEERFNCLKPFKFVELNCLNVPTRACIFSLASVSFCPRYARRILTS